MEPPDALPEGSLELVAVERSQLARGGSVSPPDSITVSSVLEHAVRHLAWLIRDDPAIADALSDWHEALSNYDPEPFRSLG